MAALRGDGLLFLDIVGTESGKYFEDESRRHVVSGVKTVANVRRIGAKDV